MPAASDTPERATEPTRSAEPIPRVCLPTDNTFRCIAHGGALFNGAIMDCTRPSKGRF